MIFGGIGIDGAGQAKARWLAGTAHRRGRPFRTVDTERLFCVCGSRAEDRRKAESVWVSPDHSRGLIWDGELIPLRGEPGNGGEASGRLWQRYRETGPDFPTGLEGAFAIAAWDHESDDFILCRDKAGLREVYYRRAGDGVIFGTGLGDLAGPEDRRELDSAVLLKYFTFCYNPGLATLFKGVSRLAPGHVLHRQSGRAEPKPYWRPDFTPMANPSEPEICEGIRERLTAAVQRRSRPARRPGVLLSGGLDSSTVLSLLFRTGAKSVKTYSFRCAGESFDESHYAKAMAASTGAQHRVIEYRPDDVLLAPEMTAGMEEPFCDVGINIGTYILARAAAAEVDDLFTGDGGDELFAGHPVYVADRAAGLIGWIPGPLLAPFLAAGRLLPDSDKKKDWKVKIKRFSESFAYPRALGTHRWRVYYGREALKKLVSPDLWRAGEPDSVFDDMIVYHRRGASFDNLSRSLDSDYQTVVQFYLRRLGLAREMGLTPQCPMLDSEVISYCASIPSGLKIRGISDTKYIERRAVQPLLPDEIVNRKDKLGHSIPLKNWMRDHAKVKTFMLDTLSPAVLKRRGIVDPAFVQKMIDEHDSRARNHSHRLWALMILELWLQTHVST